jgi:hypothetical protein
MSFNLLIPLKIAGSLVVALIISMIFVVRRILLKKREKNRTLRKCKMPFQGLKYN